MATLNFSVPDDVRREFNALFENENTSAILTGLMQQAIEEKKQQQRRAITIDKILHLRKTQNPVSADELAQAREALRR